MEHDAQGSSAQAVATAPATAAGGRFTQMEPLRLPVGIVSTGDARRLRRDIAAMQETIQAIRIRTNAPVAKLPRLSRALEEFASTNRLNFLLPDDRHQAEVYVDYVLKRAPVMHISFASEASRKFTTELIMWLRGNFDSEMLVEIGLEPNMAAGCVVRTTNKVFDFSLSKHLQSKRDMMMQMILESPDVAPPPVGEPPVPPTVEPAVPPTVPAPAAPSDPAAAAVSVPVSVKSAPAATDKPFVPSPPPIPLGVKPS